MNILILGATGTFGSALTAHLLHSTHHRLTLLARHASGIYKNTDRTRVIDGDATDPTVLSAAADGTDAIVCAISGPVLPGVAQNLVQTLPCPTTKHLIFLGAVGIYNEIPADMDGDDNLDHEPAQLPNRQAVDIIEASNLNYIVLRPGYLVDGAATDFVLTKKDEAAKGFKTTLPSLVKLTSELLEHSEQHMGENISITRDMTQPTD